MYMQLSCDARTDPFQGGRHQLHEGGKIPWIGEIHGEMVKTSIKTMVKPW